MFIFPVTSPFTAITPEPCAARGSACFTDDPADCGCLLLPGGGDLSPMLYGQTDIACRGLDPARDALEMDLLNLFTSAHRPVLGVCGECRV